ncbi:hypothetical protein PTKIN_Ptkin12aG0043800 [Pterospermum kingtungense]
MAAEGEDVRFDHDGNRGGSPAAGAKEASREETWSWIREPLQKIKARININLGSDIIEDIKKELKKFGKPVLKEFEDSCLGHFMRFHSNAYSCNTILHAIMARQVSRSGARDDEVWFHIGERFIKFSKYEFALVTGLRFGTSTFDPNGQHQPPSDGVYTTRVAKDATAKTVHGLWEKFKAGHYSDRGADALKVAKVLFVYCILFGVETRKSSVDRWVWTLVEDTDAWEAFPWGKYTYQMLMHYIEILPVSAVEGRDSMSYHFYGFAMSLLIWAYEVIPSLGKECALLVRVDERPRCLRWEFPKRTKSYFDFFDKPYVAPQKPINLTQRGPERGQKSKRSTTSMVGVSKQQKTVSAGAGDRGRTDADSEHQYVVHIEGTSHGLSCDSVDDSDTVHLDEGRMDSPQDIAVGRSEHTDDRHHGIGEEPIQEDQHAEAGDSVPASDHDTLVARLMDGLRPLIRVEVDRALHDIRVEVDRAICNIRQEVDRAHRELEGRLPRIIYTELSDFFRASDSGMHTSFGHRDVHRSFVPEMQSQMASHRSPPGSHIQPTVEDEVGAAPSHVHHEASDGGAGREAVHIPADADSSQIPSIPPIIEGLRSPSAALMTTTVVVPSVTPVVGATTSESPSRSDVIRPVRRRVESYWIRSPFVNLKRKVVDLDFRNYLSYLNSGDLVRRNVGVEIPVGPDYFRNIEHPRFDLEDQHMDPYLAILHHAPAWADLVVDVVLRDAYAVLDSAFYGWMTHIWESHHRDDAPGTIIDPRRYEELDMEELQFFIDYVHGSRPERWTRRPWHLVKEVYIPCCVDKHWFLCRWVLGSSSIDLYDSLAHQYSDEPDLERTRRRQIRPLCRILPAIVQHARLWELRKDLTPHRGELRVHIPGKTQQLVQTDSHSCGPFVLYYITCLLRRRFTRDDPEKYMQGPFRRDIAYAIYRYSETEDWLDPDVIEHTD